VANHTAGSRGKELDEATRDDLVAEVFLTIISDDFGVLRRFRRNCSLATYLTVISRRVIARQLQRSSQFGHQGDNQIASAEVAGADLMPARIENNEEIQKLLLRLDPNEASVVRMYHLEGKTYREISQSIGMTENSIGPVLSRAREKMRNGADHA
jgi:RNA polymerase sigma-70 factor (ECF subfamily)